MSLSISGAIFFDWLWRATWQASGLTVLVLAIQTCFKGQLTARWRYALWVVVRLRLALPASISAPWSVFNFLEGKKSAAQASPIGGWAGKVETHNPAPTARHGLTQPARVPEPVSLDELNGSAKSALAPERRILLGLWLAGMLVLGLRLFLASIWMSKLVSRGVRLQDSAVLDLLEDCTRLMQVKKAPVIVATPFFDSPAVFGCFCPKLLLPTKLIGTFSPPELRHIFMHELAHIRRRDSAMNWVTACLETLHWFNPLLRYGFRRMHADRELACDALVLSRMAPEERHGYGQTILKLLESLIRPAVAPGLVGILEEKQQMKRRMEMINCNARTPDRPLLASVLLAVLGMFTLTDAQTAAPLQEANTAPTAEIRAGGVGDDLIQKLRAQEREIDRQHLRRIYQAIQAYYKDHRDLPNWLSDLVPKYLADANDLISPVETRTGKSVLFGREDPKIHTSYIYEFNAGPAAEEFNKGRQVPVTCKEWKLMQLDKFGLVTPMLRCHVQEPVINVAYCGEIYETGLLWENDRNTAALIKRNPELGPRTGTAPGPGVKVHVVDADSGTPVGAAVVQSAIASEFGLLPPSHGTTDANGDVTIALGDWKINWLYLTSKSPQYYTRGFDWNRNTANGDAPPGEIVLKMSLKNH